MPAQGTAQTPKAGSSVHLRVLATTDLHAHLLPFDYFTDKRATGTGLAGLGAMIAALRQTSPNVLLVDNGDTLQGAPLADAAVAEIVPRGRTHPMIAAMNALGFDAATLGNHDFDFGLEHLEASLSAAIFPVVSANTSYPNGAEYLARRVLLDREVKDQNGQSHNLRIGITGALPPQVALWNKPCLHNRLIFEDIVAAVRMQVSALRAEGADVVVVLAHSGRGVLDAEAGAENVALQVALLPGVDAVVAGHTHKLCPEEETVVDHDQSNGAALVQPSAFGSHLGCIDLRLEGVARNDEQASLKWHVKQTRTENFDATKRKALGAIPLSRILADYPNLCTEVTRDHLATRSYVAQPLGETAVALETYFSTIAPCAATQVVADAQFIAARPLIANDPTLKDLPVLSAVAPFKSGGRSGAQSYTDIPVGPLKLRHAADLYLYPNMLSVVRITGAGIKDWLERAASIYHQIDPASPISQTLVDPNFAPYNFDRLVGLTYDIDVSKPARTNAEGDMIFDTPGRIGNLRYASGAPMGDGDDVLVITNSYRAAGGGYISAAAAAQEVITAPFSVRDAVAKYMTQAIPAVRPAFQPNFQLLPLGGVTVELATGTGALSHPKRFAELGLTAIKAAPDTVNKDVFQRFSMKL